jgi:hypothetical protein
MVCGPATASLPGAAEISAFFQPISNLTTQPVAFGGDQRPRSSMRNTEFDWGLCGKLLITPFCATSQDGHYK